MNKYDKQQRDINSRDKTIRLQTGRINRLHTALINIRHAALPDPHTERDISLKWLTDLIHKEFKLANKDNK